jgi:IS30 family transposase
MNGEKGKHLTLEERLEIQGCLDKGMSFKAIGRRIGKDATTISKEVKKHLLTRPIETKRRDSEGKPLAMEICPALLKAPFVCNPCKKRHVRCAYERRFYFAKNAQDAYSTLLREVRTGIPLNKETFYQMDRIITEGVKRGQHIYHILQSHNLGVSKSTVYRHLNQGLLSIAPIDLPRVVKFKPRRCKAEGYIPKAAKIGRTYDDFLSYTDESDIHTWVEMDTVIGRIGGKVLLTLDFTLCNFMVGLLLENKSAAQVTEKIQALKATLLANGFCFGEVFPVILTDNGGEFANVSAIENNLEGIKETALFFCDPYQSSQKPRVEKNHTLLRDILPQGDSFDALTQDCVNLIFSHVNGVMRKSLNGKSAFDFFVFTFTEQLAHSLGISRIPPKEVIQSPLLLKHIISCK